MDENWETDWLRYYIANAREWSRAAKYITSLIDVVIAGRFGEVVEIRSRVKTFESSVEKVPRKGYLVDVSGDATLDVLKAKITDILGVRVVCYFADDIYPITEVLKRNFDLVAETDKIEELEESEFDVWLPGASS